MRFVVIALVLALWTPPADACSRPYTTLFANFDRAATVVHARLGARNGKVAFDVIRTIKGAAANTIVLDLKFTGPHSTCTPRLRPRATGIVFLSKDRDFVAAYDSFPAATKDLLAAMTAYAGATDAAARAAVLVDLIARRKGRIGRDAGLALADDPEALVHVTTKDRDRLRLDDTGVDSYVPLVLARLGVPETELPEHGGARAIAKHRVFEAITKPDELAGVIEKAKGASPKAAAAFERCERLHRKRLHDVRHIDAGAVEDIVEWGALAKACRTGVPVSEL